MGQISFSRMLTDRFSFGISSKIIRENIYNSKATGFAIDLGTLYVTQIQGLTMGMSISNYGTKMKMEGRDLLLQTEVDPSLESDPININANFATDPFELPLIFRFGLSYTKLISSDFKSIHREREREREFTTPSHCSRKNGSLTNIFKTSSLISMSIILEELSLSLISNPSIFSIIDNY